MMRPTTEEETRPTWKTIEYLGAGLVLQVKMLATLEHEIAYNDDFIRASVQDVQESWEVNVETYERRDGTSRITSSTVYQPHRIVHLSELEGLDMRDVVQDVEQLGLIDDQNG